MEHPVLSGAKPSARAGHSACQRVAAHQVEDQKKQAQPRPFRRTDGGFRSARRCLALRVTRLASAPLRSPWSTSMAVSARVRLDARVPAGSRMDRLQPSASASSAAARGAAPSVSSASRTQHLRTSATSGGAERARRALTRRRQAATARLPGRARLRSRPLRRPSAHRPSSGFNGRMASCPPPRSMKAVAIAGSTLRRGRSSAALRPRRGSSSSRRIIRPLRFGPSR